MLSGSEGDDDDDDADDSGKGDVNKMTIAAMDPREMTMMMTAARVTSTTMAIAAKAALFPVPRARMA